MDGPEPGRGRAHDARHADQQHLRRGGQTKAALTYPEALRYLGEQGRFGIKLGLERTRALLALLGNPGLGSRGALVAGTNGKGSTAAFLATILTAAGHRVGTMPSPHLSSYTERVQLDGSPIAEADFAAGVAELRALITPHLEAIGQPTEFELLTALALGRLAPRADRLVIEVGMGGRLDTTNVLDLGVAIITNVDLDHRQYLGETVAEIAAEKAGIIKPGNLVVTGAEGVALGVIEEAARARGAQLWRLGHELTMEAVPRGWNGSELTVTGPGFEHQALMVPLIGLHQARNAALAVAAAHALGDAGRGTVREGVLTTRWPGRLELLPGSPRLLLDGAHNPAGMRALSAALAGLPALAPLVVVFGAMADKELEPMLEELERLPAAGVVLTAAAGAGSRGADPARLEGLYRGRAEVSREVPLALERARSLAGPGGTILVCGSLYLVGEVRAITL